MKKIKEDKLTDFYQDGILHVGSNNGEIVMFVNPMRMDALTDNDRLEIIGILTNFISVQMKKINNKNK